MPWGSSVDYSDIPCIVMPACKSDIFAHFSLQRDCLIPGCRNTFDKFNQSVSYLSPRITFVASSLRLSIIDFSPSQRSVSISTSAFSFFGCPLVTITAIMSPVVVILPTTWRSVPPPVCSSYGAMSFSSAQQCTACATLYSALFSIRQPSIGTSLWLRGAKKPKHIRPSTIANGNAALLR